MKTVYVVLKMEWPKEDTHSLDKIFADKEDAEKYCNEKERKAFKKGQEYYNNSEWYIETMELH